MKPNKRFRTEYGLVADEKSWKTSKRMFWIWVAIAALVIGICICISSATGKNPTYLAYITNSPDSLLETTYEGEDEESSPTLTADELELFRVTEQVRYYIEHTQNRLGEYAGYDIIGDTLIESAQVSLDEAMRNTNDVFMNPNMTLAEKKIYYSDMDKYVHKIDVWYCYKLDEIMYTRHNKLIIK